MASLEPDSLGVSEIVSEIASRMAQSASTRVRPKALVLSAWPGPSSCRIIGKVPMLWWVRREVRHTGILGGCNPIE